jgi:transient receptor potential cation channel subfamily C
MVRKSTHRKDPIGKRSEALSRIRNRESLRRNIVESQKSGLAMNTDLMLQYNPKLADVSHPTRVAYAKFMTSKIKKEIKFQDECGFVNEQEKTRGAMAFNKFKTNAGILKHAAEPKVVKAEVNKESSSAPPASPVPTPSPGQSPIPPSPSPTPNEADKDFRARTPIQEDPLEDAISPPPTPSDLLDEPMSSSRKSSRVDTPVPFERSMSIESAKNIKADSKSPEPNIEIKIQEPVAKESATPISKSPEPKLATPTLSPEPPKTPKKESDVPTQRKSSNANLTVPGTSQPPPSPSFSTGSTGERGKSKITGKTISGWL